MKNLLRMAGPGAGPYAVDGKDLLILVIGINLLTFASTRMMSKTISEGELVSSDVLHRAAQDAANQAYALGAEAAVATVLRDPGVYGLQVQDAELARQFHDVVVEPSPFLEPELEPQEPVAPIEDGD